VIKKLNNFPCDMCNQPEYGLYHTMEEAVLRNKAEAQKYQKVGNYDMYRHLIIYTERMIDDCRKQGWDGHSYKPVDNLTYLEIKAYGK